MNLLNRIIGLRNENGKIVTFWVLLPDAKSAGMSIFGLQSEPYLDFVNRVVNMLDASCIFVRDLGGESALAQARLVRIGSTR